MVGLWYLELFPVHRIFIFKMDSMLVVFRQSKVVFVNADRLLMLEENVQVLCFEFLRNLEIATPGNVVSSELNPGSAGNIAFDCGADVGRGVIHEGLHFILLHLDDAHDVVPLNGDVIGSTVFNDNFAILVAVNADQ